MHNRSAITLLEKLGLSRNAVKCYLASLTLGSATVAEISKVAQVNRVNAYDALKQLTECGLIEQELSKRRRRIHPAPLDTLRSLAQSYQKQATKFRWKVEDLVPVLASLAGRIDEKPRFLVFEGPRAFYQIAERSLQIPAGSISYFIHATGDFDFFCPEENPAYDREYYIPERLKRGIQARVLLQHSARARQLQVDDGKEQRETRLLSPQFRFPCMIMIYGEEIALVWRKEDVRGITIQGSPVVEVIKMLFGIAWQVARPLKKAGHRK